MMQVSHTPREFFFELGQLSQAQTGMAALVARLVTSPEHAKAILRALSESIQKYESRFGEIAEAQPPQGLQ